MKVEVQRKLLCRSDRVKCVDLHPREPWLLTALYSGQVHIWHTTEANLLKSFEVATAPVRVGKFIPRKSWIVTGSDDYHLRVLNYNTAIKVADFQAHDDFIRSAVIHPFRNLIITGSDDKTIKVWDWDQDFACTQIFEGHTNYVMQVTLSPKDVSIFASASLDKSIKVWQFGNKVANFTLTGHSQGVNCVDFAPKHGRPYLASGADDWEIRIWDYLARCCVSVLQGHTNNVNVILFATRGLPMIYSGSEDGTFKVWNVNSFKCELNVCFELGRCWTATTLPKKNTIAVGFDEGTTVVAVGNDEPLVSMDETGKILKIQDLDVFKAVVNTNVEADENALTLEWSHVTTVELYPQKLEHSPNGHYVALCGDGEWNIYTPSAFRNKSYGHGKDIAWAAANVGSNMFAVLFDLMKVRIIHGSHETNVITLDKVIRGIDGGAFLSLRTTSFIYFYDWTGNLIENVEFTAKKVYWNDNGTKVAITGKDSFYLLDYDKNAENSIGVTYECTESVTSALWIENCFVFTTSASTIEYIVCGDRQTVAHFERPVLLLRFFSNSSMLVLTDLEGNIFLRSLPLALIRYQLAVEVEDFDHADTLLASIPNEHRAKLGRFLEKQGYKKQALAVSDDTEHRFQLAIELKLLDLSRQFARELDSPSAWKTLAVLATELSAHDVCIEAFEKNNDYTGLLTLASSNGSIDLINSLSTCSDSNVRFLTLFFQNKRQECIDLLIELNRIPEAAFFARTYLPSQVDRCVSLWRNELAGQPLNKFSKLIADPSTYPNLFPGFEQSLNAEKSVNNDSLNEAHLTHLIGQASQKSEPMSEPIIHLSMNQTEVEKLVEALSENINLNVPTKRQIMDEADNNNFSDLSSVVDDDVDEPSMPSDEFDVSENIEFEDNNVCDSDDTNDWDDGEHYDGPTTSSE